VSYSNDLAFVLYVISSPLYTYRYWR